MSIEAFDDVMLDDTFVLSWRYSANSLEFDVLASLLQSHPEASLPAEGEWACYRPGTIHFSNVSIVRGLGDQASVAFATDPDGSVDYGTIDELVQTDQGKYRISGDFGVVTVVAQDVSLVLAPA